MHFSNICSYKLLLYKHLLKGSILNVRKFTVNCLPKTKMDFLSVPKLIYV